jgi:hypothetical protein
VGEREIAAEIERRLNADPVLREVLASFTPRQPRYRYWETPDGRMFLYTTEKFDDGKYGSAVMQPYGSGSRSGKGRVERWKPVREVHHSTRKAAKARAYRLFSEHKAAIAG